jgi:serine/threonine-protein kinase
VQVCGEVSARAGAGWYKGGVPLKAGEQIDRYKVIALLGSGGMGEVYQALDTRLQRQVALKLLTPQKDDPASQPSGASGSRGAARLLREARAAAALEHPNIVAIYDVGEVQEPESLRGMAFLAMELIKGRSLRAAAKDSSFNLDERLRWLVDVAKGLSAAHAQGLVHRDVKPENVMIRNDGVVKVLDFGIAKRAYRAVDSMQSTEAHIIPTLTTKGVAVGTPYYMAPEQMRNEALDGRADQFSWGVVAYELLAGRGPWRMDADALTLVSEVLSKPVESPRDLRPEIPLHVALVILKALSKSREDRFPTMESLLHEIEHPGASSTAQAPLSQPSAEVRSGGGGRNDTTAKSSPPPAPARRRRWLAVAAGAGVIVAAAVGAVANRRAATPARADAAAAALPRCSPVECTKAHGDTPHVCRKSDGACVALASRDCAVRAEKADLESDQTVWIGAMYPLSGPSAQAFGKVLSQGVELARQDFAQTMTGVASKQGKVPGIGLVQCDDVADAGAAARHLVEIGAPAVIGFRSGTEFIDLAKSVFLPAGVAMIAPLSTSPLIMSVPEPPSGPRLVWRTTYNLAHTSGAIAALVEQQFEPAAQAREKPARPTRVALVRYKSQGQLAFADAVFERLRFNGKSALENASDYRQTVLDEGKPAEDPQFVDVWQALAEFAPTVVIHHGDDDLIPKVILPLETHWPRGRARPFYVNPTIASDELLGPVARDPDLRSRFFSLTPVSSTPANARLVMHYNEVFPDKITRVFSPNADYDAFYMIAYAVYALGAEPVTGSAIARAFARLQPPGTSIEVGPTHIFEAFNALERGENIDLTGATGRLDFDLATGEAPVDQAVLCVGWGEKGHAETIESGLVYDSAANRLRGKLRCP